jgi:hypothetical protein
MQKRQPITDKEVKIAGIVLDNARVINRRIMHEALEAWDEDGSGSFLLFVERYSQRAWQELCEAN